MTTLCALLASPVAAQQAPVAAPEVVVTGELAPPPGTAAYGTSVITRARLQTDAADRVEDVLRDVAGVQQFRRSDSRSANPSAQGLTLRALGGNAASRTLVLLDGVPVADPFFGYIPFTALALDRLGTIRVTRGSGAGPFGAGAVAGTVELVSADRRMLPPASGEAFVGSNDAQSVAATLSPDLGNGFASLSGRYERGDGFLTTPASQRVAATVPARYRDWSAALRTVAAIDGLTELQARLLAFDDHRTLRFAGADSRSQGEDASLRLIHRGAWQIDALAYLQARNFANRTISATTYRLTLDQRATPSTGLGAKIELRPPVGAAHALRIGGDVRRAEGTLYENAYAATGAITARRDAGGRTSVAGLFAEDDWTLGKLVVTGGARIDRWTLTDGYFRQRDAAGSIGQSTRYPARRGTEATGRGGAVYRPTAGVALRAAAYTGFRVPTLNELYRPFVLFPVTTQANAALSPERLRGAEAGIDLRPAHAFDLGATLFVNRLSDAIANVTIGPNLRQRRNVAAIVARGVEATLGWQHGAVGIDASYAHTDPVVRAPGTALDGRRPAESPADSASATLAWRPRLAQVSATLRYVGAAYDDDLESDRLPPATTLDLFAGAPLTRDVSVVVRLENAFDARVVTRNQAGSIDLGAPRLVWAGLRFKLR